MNYIGSKLKLSSWINNEIAQTINPKNKIFCDLFAGTGIVGRTFKAQAKHVISNDIENYSFVLNKNYIENHLPIQDKEKYIEKLNNLPLVNTGLIYKNYCLGGSERQYFSDENGKKIDTIRQQIENWHTTKEIGSNLYYFLLASLIESSDKVANTASVYGAYLKHLKKSAQKALVLKGAEFIINDNEHKVYQEDANDLIKKVNGDILYLDPPYNARQYGANYHLLNTIAKYDEFIPKGKTGLREYNKSHYCKKNEVLHSFEDLIKNTQFQHIFLSYNNEGLMSVGEIREIMQKYGKYQVKTKEYQRFKADSNRYNKLSTTTEYLHILEK